LTPLYTVRFELYTERSARPCRVSNCVGYRNYRYFVSFLFWTTAATAYVSFLSGILLFRRGSILFPTNGRPFTSVLSEAVAGTLQNNIYRDFYELLTSEEADRRLHKQKAHNKLLHTLEEVAEVMEEKGGERRRLTADGAWRSVPISDTVDYIDLQQQRRLDASEPPGTLQHFGDILKADTIGVLTELNRRPRRTPHDRLHRERRDAGLLAEGSPHLARSEGFKRPHRVVDGPGSISMIGALLWLAPQEMLVFIAFVLSFGVCVGTGSLLSFHLYLSKL
jgi:NTP pyrophosphatase (non-canonical NTP hydrolase)